jgi:hypothetical protein
LGPASFVMILIGCSQGEQCAPVMTLPVAYRTEASCLADRTAMIAATGSLGHGRVFAECRKQSVSDQASAPAGPARSTPIA